MLKVVTGVLLLSRAFGEGGLPGGGLSLAPCNTPLDCERAECNDWDFAHCIAADGCYWEGRWIEQTDSSGVVTEENFCGICVSLECDDCGTLEVCEPVIYDEVSRGDATMGYHSEATAMFCETSDEFNHTAFTTGDVLDDCESPLCNYVDNDVDVFCCAFAECYDAFDTCLGGWDELVGNLASSNRRLQATDTAVDMETSSGPTFVDGYTPPDCFYNILSVEEDTLDCIDTQDAWDTAVADMCASADVTCTDDFNTLYTCLKAATCFDEEKDCSELMTAVEDVIGESDYENGLDYDVVEYECADSADYFAVFNAEVSVTGCNTMSCNRYSICRQLDMAAQLAFVFPGSDHAAYLISGDCADEVEVTGTGTNVRRLVDGAAIGSSNTGVPQGTGFVDGPQGTWTAPDIIDDTDNEASWSPSDDFACDIESVSFGLAVWFADETAYTNIKDEITDFYNAMNDGDYGTGICVEITISSSSLDCCDDSSEECTDVEYSSGSGASILSISVAVATLIISLFFA